jgi:hypothetical protein
VQDLQAEGKGHRVGPKSIQLGIRQDIFMRMHWAYTSHVGALDAAHYWHVKIGGKDDGLWEPGK